MLIALFNTIVLRNPLSSCHSWNIGKEAFCVNSCMSFVVLSSDPSSAMMISEGNIVCLKILSKQSRKASGQLYVAIKESKKRGKKNYIIINAEGVGDSVNLAKTIEERTGMETRATILGHMQRGGSPTCKDRVYASIMGSMAVDLLLEGKTNRIVGYRHGEYVDFDIEEALGMQKGIPAYQYEISKKLSL